MSALGYPHPLAHPNCTLTITSTYKILDWVRHCRQTFFSQNVGWLEKLSWSPPMVDSVFAISKDSLSSEGVLINALSGARSSSILILSPQKDPSWGGKHVFLLRRASKIHWECKLWMRKNKYQRSCVTAVGCKELKLWVSVVCEYEKHILALKAS